MRLGIAILIFMILNSPIYWWLFRRFFKTKDEFKESLYYLFRWDMISLFKGEYWEDFQEEMKIKLFLALCFLIVVIELLVFKDFIKP